MESVGAPIVSNCWTVAPLYLFRILTLKERLDGPGAPPLLCEGGCWVVLCLLWGVSPGRMPKAKNTSPSFYPEAGAAGGHCRIADMKRVVILGRGASGKSTLAVSLGEITGLPVIELDKIFWQPGLVATPRDHWTAIQERLVAEERWIMDGDLGPYDVVEIRFRAADTILFLDFSLLCCAWRAIRRSHERGDFWQWLLTYHWQVRPILMEAIAKHAANADLHVFRNPEALRRFVAKVARESGLG